MLNYVHAVPGDDLMGHMLSVMPLLGDDYSIHALLDGEVLRVRTWRGWRVLGTLEPEVEA